MDISIVLFLLGMTLTAGFSKKQKSTSIFPKTNECACNKRKMENLKMQSMFAFSIILFISALTLSKEITIGVGALPMPEEIPHVRSVNKSQVLRQIYDSLFYVNDYGSIQSTFFSEWNVSVKRKTITFKLKEGLTFSDGTSITSSDMVHVFNRKFNDGTLILPEIENIKIKKNNLIQIRFKKISKIIFDKLTDISFLVYSNKKDKWNFPVGSGIFKIISYNNNEIKLARNQYHEDFKTGNIEHINVKLLPKYNYTEQELESLGISFFPLIHILNSDFKPRNFNRVVYPSHRIAVVVLNIENINHRKLLRSCIDSMELLSMPYHRDEIIPYYSIIPIGIENYNPSPMLKSNYNENECKNGLSKLGNERSYTWLNSYTSPDDIKFIESIIKKINKLASKNVIKIKNVDLQEAQEQIKNGNFDIFPCSIGSPIPIVDGIVSDFIYSKGRNNTLIKYEDYVVKNNYNEYNNAPDILRSNKVNKLINTILDRSWVVPFGRKISTFYIPTNWTGLSMLNGMNGNFYLGKIVIHE